MRISNREAGAEAIRIAEVFVASEVPDGGRWAWECGGAQPDVLVAGHQRRKAAINWTVIVRWIPKGGGEVDGPGIVHVNIETREAAWLESP